MSVLIKRQDAHSSKTTVALQKPVDGPPNAMSELDGAGPAPYSNGLVGFHCLHA